MMTPEYSDSESDTRELTISAPGKILLAGGYLVLEPQNTGLVIAVDKRFFTTIQVVSNKIKQIVSHTTIPIRVSSPQFELSWIYSYDRTNHDLTSEDAGKANDFVEKALEVALMYLNVMPEVAEIRITIQADNEFYSLVPHLQERNLDFSLESCQTLDKFLPIRRVKGQILKSGLGSSACLVTSLVAALCFGLEKSFAEEHHQSVITKLSQIAHCYAQGKVGSGFDVSAASLASHVYRRFSKSSITDLMAQLERKDDKSVQKALRQRVDDDWTSACVVDPIHFTSGSVLQVILADVSGGSESPGMASQVLKWKDKQSEPLIWNELARINQRIVELFQTALSSQPSEDERTRLATSFVKDWITQPDEDSSIAKTLLELRQTFLEARHKLKTMGDEAGVSIEPDGQTQLADSTMELPGVVAALCPGAGGFDAIACIYIADKQDSARERIANFWAHWSRSQVCPLDVRGLSYGDGVRLEEPISDQVNA
jgi:phosphomevalonate kinase